MSYLPLPDNCTSPAILKVAEKLSKSRRPPKVNLPAIARRAEEFMACWLPDPGYVFVSSDFVSLEPSITASFADDPFYQYATFGGVGKPPYINDTNTLMIDDVYLMVASVMPEIGPDILTFFSDPVNIAQWVEDSEVIKDNPIIKPLRKRAKPACLGFNYGMGPKRFVTQSYDAGIPVTLTQAKGMYKAYWELFKGVRKFTKQLEKMIEQSGSITNVFGYRLTTDPYKGYNAYIQSTASGVLDVFCLKFFAECPDAEFVAMVHDEVIYQIPIAQLEEAKRIQDNCVASLNKDLNFPIPMRLGFTIAQSFKEIK